MNVFEKMNLKFKLKGESSMWVVTVFEKNTVRMFEFAKKGEASLVMKKFPGLAILSFTN